MSPLGPEAGPQAPEGRDRSEVVRSDDEADHRPGDVAWTGENQSELGPRIYVASLSDYNHGVLHGAWLQAGAGVEAMEEGIQQMLATSPTAKRLGEPAEEWLIDDFDGWGRYSYIEEFESLAKIAKMAEGRAAHGEAFGAWVELCGASDLEDLELFEEVFLGEFGSLEAYCESICEDMGIDLDDLGRELPEGLRPYLRLDVGSWVRDLELGGAIGWMDSRDGVYVFSI